MILSKTITQRKRWILREKLQNKFLSGDKSVQEEKTKEVNINTSFYGKPFYCWDTTYLGKRECCFNHMIGLPEKDGIPKPLFPYQFDVFTKWQNNKHLWIKKATGLGISEFFLRLMLWLCLKDDSMQYCQMGIVTGPNIDLAKKLMKRMRNMIQNYPGFKFDTETDYVLEVNKCWIQAYPSHNLGSYRSLDRLKFSFIDEGDFFPVGQLQDVRDTSERYIAKSNPDLVMVSTPNRPNGLFEQIELEKDCIYERIFLDYKVGEDLIYSKQDIEKAKQSPSFEREYNLKYGYGLGNVFLPTEIESCITTTEYKVNNGCAIAMGIDPGFGSSKFGITILQLEDNILKVLVAEEYDRPSYEHMIHHVNQLKVIYKPNKIFVDGSKPDFIKSLKTQFMETTDYEPLIDQAKKEKIDPDYKMYVCPVSFNEYGRELLGRFQHVVSKHWFSIPDKYNELITQMRMAKFKDNGNLDKDEAGSTNNTYDVFDSTRLALKMFDMGE